MVGALSRLGCACLIGVMVGGCSAAISTESTLAKRLADRGPVPLSPDNPYIASNLLLNKEMERSPELRGFIEHRGQPSALQVERSLLGPLKLTLFYTDKGERFDLESVDGTWIISAPRSLVSGGKTVTAAVESAVGVEAAPALAHVIERDSVKQVDTPEIVVAGRIESAFVNNQRLTSPSESLSSEPEVRAGLKAIPFSSPEKSGQPLTVEIPESRAELLGRLITAAAGQTAEISPRGDVVHYVTDPRESFSLIAEWYTDSPINAPRVARMNGSRETTPLEAGDSVVIPSYLVVNKNRLSDEAIAVLAAP